VLRIAYVGDAFTYAEQYTEHPHRQAGRLASMTAVGWAFQRLVRPVLADQRLSSPLSRRQSLRNPDLPVTSVCFPADQFGNKVHDSLPRRLHSTPEQQQFCWSRACDSHRRELQQAPVAYASADSCQCQRRRLATVTPLAAHSTTYLSATHPVGCRTRLRCPYSCDPLATQRLPC
jgi:hypothetical protein